MSSGASQCDATKKLTQGYRVRRFIAIEAVARRKLRRLETAMTVNVLRLPPGNRLETLAGERAGTHSIRINDQWRLCFCWTEHGAANVEIFDYHGGYMP